MSSRVNIDDLFRKELDGMQHEPSDALWQKLDAQLQPDRDAYHKKDRKKRAAAWIWLAALLLVGGATWYIARNGSGSGASTTTAKNQPAETGKLVNTNAQPANAVPPGNGSNTSNTVNPQTTSTPGNDSPVTTTGTTKTTQPAPVTIVNDHSTPQRTTSNTPKIVAASVDALRKDAPPATKIKSAPVKVKRDKIDVTRSSKGKVKNGKEDADTDNVPAPVDDMVADKPAVAEDKTDKKVKEIPVAVVPAGEDKQTPAVVEAPTDKTVQPKPETPKQTAKAAKTKPVLGKSGISLMAGANLSSPFKKPGVYGGAMFTKTIGDKHIFAGLKISDNHLEHQFISASKQNQAAPETDAIIQRLTILQLPFGYEFAVGKKRTTFLQTGFEPAYITGLRTIFYDDNGVPGGPRTPVVNSPLMDKAINRFNLSFIAGVRKQVTPRIGFSLTGGYSLIDITDKQYYNRTSTNNNLKYIQAGLLFRLNK